MYEGRLRSSLANIPIIFSRTGNPSRKLSFYLSHQFLFRSTRAEKKQRNYRPRAEKNRLLPQLLHIAHFNKHCTQLKYINYNNIVIKCRIQRNGKRFNNIIFLLDIFFFFCCSRLLYFYLPFGHFSLAWVLKFFLAILWHTTYHTRTEDQCVRKQDSALGIRHSPHCFFRSVFGRHEWGSVPIFTGQRAPSQHIPLCTKAFRLCLTVQ